MNSRLLRAPGLRAVRALYHRGPVPGPCLGWAAARRYHQPKGLKIYSRLLDGPYVFIGSTSAQKLAMSSLIFLSNCIEMGSRNFL